MSDLNSLPFCAISTHEAEALIKKWVLEVIDTAHSNEPVKSEPDKFLTRQDACEILRISLPTLSKYTSLKIIEAKKIGTRILYSPEAIKAACQELQSAKYKRR